MFLNFTRGYVDFLVNLASSTISLLIRLLLLKFRFKFRENGFLFVLFGLTTFVFGDCATTFRKARGVFREFVLFASLFFNLVSSVIQGSGLKEGNRYVAFPKGASRRTMNQTRHFRIGFTTNVFCA